MSKIKIIRTATVPISLDFLLRGQLAYLQNYYQVIAVSGQDDHLENVRQREGVCTISVSMERSISPLQDLIALLKLFFLFRKEKPQIVHSITPKAGLLSMTAAYFAGVPIRMHTFTGLIFPSKTGIMQKLLIKMDRLLCFFATHIFPEGNGVKGDLIAYRITSKPLKVLANGNVNGIDTTYFNPNNISDLVRNELSNMLGIKKDDFVFIFVGRLVGDKGINELVQTFLEIQINNSQVKLLLVGPLETNLDPLLPQTLLAISSNINIKNVGYQEDVRPYFAISDVLVFPSYREGFPNVVMQAGAMGLPSIVTNINGCNEIIADGENGLIIPTKNTGFLKEAMLRLLNDKNLYNCIKENSRPTIVQNFEQIMVWQAILEEYRKAEHNV